MATIGIDLGKHVAAVRVEYREGEYVCDWAEGWAYDDIDGARLWCIESAALWMEKLISKQFGPRKEWANATDIVIEKLWLTKAKYIDPMDLLPMAAQQAILYTDAFQWYDVHEVNPSTVSTETGMTKGLRASQLPLIVKGLDLDQFKGPRGGMGETEHVADAATLAYYGESRRVFEARKRGEL